MIGMLFTGSRGVTIAVIVAILVYFSLDRDISIGRIGLYSIAGVIILGICVLLFQHTTNVFHRETPFARLEIWAEGFTVLASSSPFELLLGNGHRYFITEVGESPHNGYIRFLIDYGIVFLVLYSILVYYLGRYLYFSREVDSSFWLSVLVFLLVRDMTDQAIFHIRFESFVFMLVVLVCHIWLTSNWNSNQTID
ncbi:O-antigen ligase family protein [Natrialba chahannaoensis]|uniref:O-antigen ligase family protein n=1 Tax=Natrialba chahannaoensis TaxID=68911 RepID=UPI00373AEB1A